MFVDDSFLGAVRRFMKRLLNAMIEAIFRLSSSALYLLAAAVIIIAAYKSFSIPSDMEEISNSTFRLQCFRRRIRIVETTIILSILFDYMKNNSPQRARKRSFKYMIY
jgi:hypothetical protein